MGPHEVVECNKESGQCTSSVKGLEAGPWAGVIFVSSVEALNKLFELAVFSAFLVQVFKPDDGFFGQFVGVVGDVFIIGQDGRIVGRVAIGDEFRGRVSTSRLTVAVVEQREGRLHFSFLGEVVSANSSGFRVNDEPGVSPLSIDNDVGFIGGGDIGGRRAIRIDIRRQVGGGGTDIVQDGLVRDGDVEDALKCVSCQP